MVGYKAIAGLLLSCGVMTAPTARAASLDPVPAVAGQHRTGAFAGARVRIALGGGSKASAGLTLAPIQRALVDDGSMRLRFGEGLALGVSDDGPVALRLAGARLDRLHVSRNGRIDASGARHGISTAGYIAIGVGVAVIVGGLLFVDALNDASE